MFSKEINGYNKKEVEQYIDLLKTEHERKLMDERIKLLEAEQKILNFKKKSEQFEKREKNIYAILESFKKMQEESNNNIANLRKEQLNIIYTSLHDFLEDIARRYPEILVDTNYQDIMSNIEKILGIKTGNAEAIKMLLSKMKDSSNPREIKIERETNSRIKPVCDMELNKNDKYDTLVDKFLNTRPQDDEVPKIEIQSSSFDLKEAINPKDDLSEIMKAFDFYTGGNGDEE